MDWGFIAAPIISVAVLIAVSDMPSVKTESVEVPAEETVSDDQLVMPDDLQMPDGFQSPSDGGLVPQEELKAAGDRIAARARDFGSDCAAAEAYFTETRGDARCKPLESGLVMIYSDTGLPKDPASKDAEEPMPLNP